MRTITVNGKKYKWMVGKSNVKIACPEIHFSHIIDKSKIGDICWDCDLGCNSNPKNKETGEQEEKFGGNNMIDIKTVDSYLLWSYGHIVELLEKGALHNNANVWRVCGIIEGIIITLGEAEPNEFTNRKQIIATYYSIFGRKKKWIREQRYHEVVWDLLERYFDKKGLKYTKHER